MTTLSAFDPASILSRNNATTTFAKGYQSNVNFAQLVASNMSQGVAGTEESVNSLLRPSAGYFAELTGVDVTTATDLVYGVIGSNKDTRDWQAIMTSSDPLTAARQATAAMYNGGGNYASASNRNTISEAEKIAASGNFALQHVITSANTVAPQSLELIDSQGMLLRDAGRTPEQIQQNAWVFGFDTSALQSLVAPAKALSPALGDAIAQVASGSVPTPALNRSNQSSAASSVAQRSNASTAGDTLSLVTEQRNWAAASAATTHTASSTAAAASTATAAATSTATTTAATAAASTQRSASSLAATLSSDMDRLTSALPSVQTASSKVSQLMASYKQLQGMLASL